MLFLGGGCHGKGIKSRRKTRSGQSTFTCNPKFLSLTASARHRVETRSERKRKEKERLRERNRGDSIPRQDGGKERDTAKHSTVFLFPLSFHFGALQAAFAPSAPGGEILHRGWAASANCDYGFRVSPADFTSPPARPRRESRMAHPLFPPSNTHPPFSVSAFLFLRLPAFPSSALFLLQAYRKAGEATRGIRTAWK